MAAVAMPRFTAEWVSLKISSGVANWVKELPSCEMVWPVQNFQKSGESRWRSVEEDAASIGVEMICEPADT